MINAITLDLETTGAHRLWADPVGTHVRISGWAVGGGPVHLDPSQDQGKLLDAISHAKVLAGHNILGYDLLALHRHHQVPSPFHLLAQGVVLHDTQLTEAIIDPPEARMGSGEASRHYNLDQVAQRHGVGGKSLNLKQLAGHYKKAHLDRHPEYQDQGFELIPLDNPDFLRYLRQDVTTTRALLVHQLDRLHDLPKAQAKYLAREHRLAAIAARMTINGTRVDTQELDRRVTQGRARRAELLQHLHDRYGLPREDAKGKPYKAPQATTEGKLAIATAFADAGIPLDEFKAKARSGAPDLSQDHMKELIQIHGQNPAVVSLAELVMDLNGIRSIYEDIARNLADGRVHPTITLRQASGRWSLTNPGMTVVGKRDGRVIEREVFLADEGEVILSVDLSQVDARAVAVFSQDPAYMALFDVGKDLWTELATRFGISRAAAKSIGHGANYGQGPKGVVRTNPTVNIQEAERFHAELRQQFPGLIAWQNQVRERGQAGELLDNGWGRKLRVNPDRAYTQAPALMGQSSARDIMMHGLLRMDPALHPYLRLLVHDEVVLSVPEALVKDVAQTVVEAMTFPWAPPGALDPIMIQAEASIGGRTWASAY